MFKNMKSGTLNGRWTIILFILNLWTVCGAFSQNLDSKFNELQAVVGDDYKIRNKGKLFIVEGFREGKQVKIDEVNVFDLDIETLNYSDVDGTVSLKCYSDLEGCVKQTLLIDKKKSYRKRLVFGVSGNDSGKIIEENLRSLLTEMVKTL